MPIADIRSSRAGHGLGETAARTVKAKPGRSWRAQSLVSVIEPLAECNSACAHVHSGDGYFEAYRLLDVSGQLGFHAP